MITESVPPQKILVTVDFARPFHAHNVNEFTLELESKTVNVTWAMRGSNLYIMKLMSVFMNMDKVARSHFETGLESLKAVAEKK